MDQDRQPNLLLVDDHYVVRIGIKDLLTRQGGVEDIEEASTGSEALSMVKSKAWGLVVLDISLPDMTGLDVLKEIKNVKPEQAVLMFSSHEEELFALSCIRAGAAGYITKNAEPSIIVEAVRRTMRGEFWISNSLQSQIVSGKTELHEQLTDREHEVLLGISRGFSLTELGQKLGLHVKTISTHRNKILQKMKMETNAELIKYVTVKKLDKGVAAICSSWNN